MILFYFEMFKTGFFLCKKLRNNNVFFPEMSTSKLFPVLTMFDGLMPGILQYTDVFGIQVGPKMVWTFRNCIASIHCEKMKKKKINYVKDKTKYLRLTTHLMFSYICVEAF